MLITHLEKDETTFDERTFYFGNILTFSGRLFSIDGRNTDV